MQKLILTFFYVGLIPRAPGTWGSIAGALIAYLVLLVFSQVTLLLLGILIFVFSIKIIDKFEETSGIHDSSTIVIDEVAGVFFAISIGGISVLTALSGENSPQTAGGVSILAILLSLIFFRIFDIWKPSIIGRVDRGIKGGLGVMLDDAIAGGVAGISTLIILSLMVKFGLSDWIF